jgi:hypothetical protein
VRICVSEYVFVCVSVRDRACVCVTVCERERVRVCVCVCVCDSRSMKYCYPLLDCCISELFRNRYHCTDLRHLIVLFPNRQDIVSLVTRLSS